MRTTIQTPIQSTTDLNDNLLREISRVKELLGVYNSLPNNIGIVSAQKLKIHLAHAEKALREKDLIQMLQTYSILQECQ